MKNTKPQDWGMIRGDTMSFNVTIEGLETDLTSCNFTVKTYKDKQIAFQKTLEDGCNKIETGKYNVRVAPEDTAEISPGVYRMDLEIAWNDDVYTPLWGTLRITEDETTQEGANG